MADEILKDIPGYEGLYKASNLGRIYSEYSKMYLKEIEVDNGKGDIQLKVTLYKDKIPKIFTISNLIALTFIGPCPIDEEVCHNNGDPLNNKLSNLRYDTHEGNMEDKLKHGTDIRGENHPNSIFSNEQILKIIEKYNTGGYTHESLAREYSVHKSTITKILSGINYKYVEREILEDRGK